MPPSKAMSSGAEATVQHVRIKPAREGRGMRVLNSRSPQDCATSGTSINALPTTVCDGGHDVEWQFESKHREREVAPWGIRALWTSNRTATQSSSPRLLPLP